MNQEGNRTVCNTLLMGITSNLNTKKILMAALGWPFSCSTGIKVNLAELASLGHVIRPLLWLVLSCSLHMKALEFATFVVRDLILLTQGFCHKCSLRMKRLDLAPFTLRMWKNATCLRDHFAQYDFKKSPPFWKFAMKLWIIQWLPLFISCTIAEFCVTSSLSLDNWGQKYCQTLGNKPNLSIPTFFLQIYLEISEKLPGF